MLRELPEKVIHLPKWEGECLESPWMKFRLTYEGELRPNQRDPENGGRDKLAEHKHKIRQNFHRQLKELWKTDWFLSNTRVNPRDYGISRAAGGESRTSHLGDRHCVPLIDTVKNCHREHGYEFVPLVRKDWRLLCNLDILFLRRDPPGSALHAGDIDNRIKTLIDCLRKPENGAELAGNELPQDGESPFFCLLEDDKLVTGFSVETDRLLMPTNTKPHASQRDVSLVISVEIKPYDVTQFNLSFA